MAAVISEDDARTYGIEHKLFFTESLFGTSSRDIMPMGVYFDTAHDEDYYHGMQPGGKYIFKSPQVPNTDPSAFGIFPAEVTSKILLLSIQDDYATQYSLSLVLGNNRHLSKFKSQIQFYHNLENISALEKRITSSRHKLLGLLDKFRDRFKIPFLLLSDALIQGYVTFFHWLVSMDERCQSLMGAIFDTVSDRKNVLPLSYNKYFEPTKKREVKVYAFG